MPETIDPVKYYLTSQNRPITDKSLTNQMLNSPFQDLDFANYSTNKNTLGLNLPLGNKPLGRSNWYPYLNTSLGVSNRKTRTGTPGTLNSAGLDVGYQIGDWKSKPGIEGDINFELRNNPRNRNRNFNWDTRANLGTQYINNSLEPYMGGRFGLDYTFGNRRRNPIGNIGAGLDIRMPFRSTKEVDLGMSPSGINRTIQRDRGLDQSALDIMRLNPYIKGNLNLGRGLGLSGKAGYNIAANQPFYQAGLTYNLGDKMKTKRKYSHGGPPPHPENFGDFDLYRSEIDDTAGSLPINSLLNSSYDSNLSEADETDHHGRNRRRFNWPWHRRRRVKASFPYGGQPQQQGGQGDQLQQIIMAYAQISNQDPQTIMQQLEQIPPEEQEQAIQQMVMAIQEGGQGNVPQMGFGGGGAIGALIKGIKGGIQGAASGTKGGGAGVGNFVEGLFGGMGMPGVGGNFGGGNSPVSSTSVGTKGAYSQHVKDSGEYDAEGNLISKETSGGLGDLKEGVGAFLNMSGMGGDFMGGNLDFGAESLPITGEGTLSQADWGELNTQNDPNFQTSQGGYEDYVKGVNQGGAQKNIGDKINPMMQKFGNIFGSGEGGTGGIGGTGGFDLSSILGLLGKGGEGDQGKLQELLNDPKVLELIQQYGGNLGGKAYGGPRNPYACGGPKLPYKRAMGGSREENTNIYRGATHEQGGIPLGYDYGGRVNPNKIEVEEGEVSWIDPNGGEEYIFSDRIEFKSGGRTKRKK